jgi:hypothetical protein
VHCKEIKNLFTKSLITFEQCEIKKKLKHKIKREASLKFSAQSEQLLALGLNENLPFF